MKKYQSLKTVQAEPCSLGYFIAQTKRDPYAGMDQKPEVETEGYMIHYPDGYVSWCPKTTFEKDYHLVTETFDFGTAIGYLKEGHLVCRKGWNGKGMFVVKQVPAHITGEIIPKMQSLPEDAKAVLMGRETPQINYTSQCLLVQPDGRADSWVPSISDVFAEDWQLYANI